MHGKPIILLVPNVAWWIIGEMGRNIVSTFRSQFDFYFVPESVLLRRPDLLAALVSSADIVHCLNESSVPIITRDGRNSAPIMTWIHHITQWSPDLRLS